MKKYCLVFLLVILIFPVLSHSEIKVWGANGIAWDMFSHQEKYIYVSGVFDGTCFCKGGTNKSTIKKVYSSSYEEYIAFIDQFYKNPLNTLIPAVWLIRLSSMVIEGMTDKEFNKEIILLRKIPESKK